MVPDVNLKEHYYSFINDSKEDAYNYSEKLNTIILLKEDCYNYIKAHENYIIDKLKINLNNYVTEWIDKEYSKDEKLFNKANNNLKIYREGEERIVLLQICKYCTILHNIYKYKQIIKAAEERAKINYKTWLSYVGDYYNTVHKCVLQGFAYSYSNGIGDLIINRWKFEKSKRPIIDFDATNRKKKELIAAGKKLYNSAEADWYKARNIKYDGEDYRVYKIENFYYEITIINSKIIPSSRKEFQRSEYVNKNLRGLGYREVADRCVNINDIYYIPADLKYKLNCLLYKYPTEYLKFIRNVEQQSFKCGAHNSQNRQRFQSR